jgi:uncharacterized delta-60 repeat protein
MFRRRLAPALLSSLLGIGVLAAPAPAASGGLDTSFSGDGKALLGLGAKSDESVDAAVVQTDGRIVLAADRSVRGAASDILMTRLTRGGALDQTFSGNGWIAVNVRGSGLPTDTAVDGDGAIVVVGSAETLSDSDAAILRFTARGALDRSFSGDGQFFLSFPSAKAYPQAVATLPNGKILVVGGVDPNTGDNDMFVLRLTHDGHLDRTFSGDGRRLIDFGAGMDDWGNAVATDGSSIVVGGSQGNGPTTTTFAIARLTAGGPLDGSFSGDGLATVDALPGGVDYATALFVNGDGTYLLVGVGSPTDSYGIAFAQVTAAGLPDPTFGGGDGTLTSDPTAAEDYPGPAGIVRSGGKIVVAGASVGSVTKIQVVRYRADGSLDTGFGGGDGFVTTNITPYSVAYAGAVTSKGKIVAAGRRAGTTDDMAVTRYLR